MAQNVINNFQKLSQAFFLKIVSRSTHNSLQMRLIIHNCLRNDGNFWFKYFSVNGKIFSLGIYCPANQKNHFCNFIFKVFLNFSFFFVLRNFFVRFFLEIWECWEINMCEENEKKNWVLQQSTMLWVQREMETNVY